MLIKITRRISDNEFWYPVLDVIIQLVERPDSRHAIDPTGIAGLTASGWVRTRPALAETLRASAKSRFHSQASDAVSIILDNVADGEGDVDRDDKTISVSPFDALVLLTSPLYVLVENETSDGAFLLWMARLLDLPIFREGYDSSRVTFRQVGGKGEMIKSAKALSKGVWEKSKSSRLPLSLRAVAILDSDARYPGHQPNAPFADGTAPFVAFVHTLNRRTIENYLAPRFFKRRLAGENKDQNIDAYFRLSLDQRRHYSVKEGFRGSDKAPQDHATFLADVRRDQNEKDLFVTVPAIDWPRLQEGFGSRMADVFTENHLRCEPKHAVEFDQDVKDECRKLIKDIIAHM